MRPEHARPRLCPHGRSPVIRRAYEVAPVSDGGTLSGKVTFAGAVPTKKIIPTKDKEVCGDIREEPEIVVGADKGVTDAVVYLKAVEKGKAWQKPAQKLEIVNKNCRFVPNVQAPRSERSSSSTPTRSCTTPTASTRRPPSSTWRFR